MQGQDWRPGVLKEVTDVAWAKHHEGVSQVGGSRD